MSMPGNGRDAGCRRTAWLLAVAAGFIMGGCTSAITSDEPYAGLPDKSAGITAPHPTRAQVESAMGPAYIASAYWQLAVFRDADLQKSVEFLWLPIPVPMMVSTDQLYRYTLVEYGSEGLVTAMDSGLHRIPSSLKLGTDGEYVRLHLTAGDYDWVCAYGEEILIASPARRDAYLADARASPLCTVVIGCAAQAVPMQLWVDGANSPSLPRRLYLLPDGKGHCTQTPSLPWMPAGQRASVQCYNALSALALEPGRHTLRFLNATGESGEFMGGDQSVTLEGRAGELLFVHLAEATVEAGGRSLIPGPTWSVSWKVDVLPSLPPVLLDRPLILNYNGSWLVMPEPALRPQPSGGPAQN